MARIVGAPAPRAGETVSRIADAGAERSSDVGANGTRGTPSDAQGAASADAGASGGPDGLDRVLAEEDAYGERAQERLLLARQRFDIDNEQRAELIREQDAVRDMLMAQLKDEDAYLKKWIELI